MNPALKSPNTKPNKRNLDSQMSPSFRIGMWVDFSENPRLGHVLEAFAELGFGVGVIACGTGSEGQNVLFEQESLYPEMISLAEDLPENRVKVIRESQILVTNQALDKATLKQLAQNGTVLVCQKNQAPAELKEFDVVKESGEIFMFEVGNFWDFLSTVLRAYETHKFPYDWKQCQKRFAKVVGV